MQLKARLSHVQTGKESAVLPTRHKCDVCASPGVLLNVILPECIITIILLALLTLLGALAVAKVSGLLTRT